MTEATPDRDLQKGNAASALPLAVRRSEQPDFAPSVVPEPDDFDPNDTTSILQGGKAFSGKAILSAARTAVSADPFGLYQKTIKERDEREAQEARELAHLTEWNTRTTMIAGVQMTNAEAQEARRHVADHCDEHAEQAVRNGDIGEEQREDFKRGIRRKIELQDKRGRGTITAPDEQEEQALDRSRVGQAIDKATATQHQLKNAALAPADASPVTNAALRGERPALEDYAAFQAAPAAPRNPPPNPSAPLAPAVRTMGLGL